MSEALLPSARRLRTRLLAIDPDEASFARRGFVAADPAARERLELCGRTFVRGYRMALAQPDPVPLAATLTDIEGELRGFAYEGAGMALALLDQLTPWTRGARLQSFIAGPASSHVYMTYVGAGWALARLRRPPRSALRLDPLLGWLAVDGYGFHHGYFTPRRRLLAQRIPSRLGGYTLRAFDQGLGRSVWFAAGGDAQHAVAIIDRFDPFRRRDLWSGIALAVTYAGPASRETLDLLRDAGTAHAAQLAQGAAFAAAARDRAGNAAAHTELSCRHLAGCSAREAAKVTTDARRNLPLSGVDPAYEVWRARIRQALVVAAPPHAAGHH